MQVAPSASCIAPAAASQSDRHAVWPGGACTNPGGCRVANECGGGGGGGTHCCTRMGTGADCCAHAADSNPAATGNPCSTSGSPCCNAAQGASLVTAVPHHTAAATADAAHRAATREVVAVVAGGWAWHWQPAKAAALARSLAGAACTDPSLPVCVSKGRSCTEHRAERRTIKPNRQPCRTLTAQPARLGEY